MKYFLLMVVMVVLGCGSDAGRGSGEYDRSHEFAPADWDCDGLDCVVKLFNDEGQDCTSGVVKAVTMHDDQCGVGVCANYKEDFCTVRCGDGIGDCFGLPEICVEIEVGSGRSYCIPLEFTD